MSAFGRRTFLASWSGTFLALSGCLSGDPSPSLAHWITVYLGDREETHEVTVTVENGSGDTLFEQDYRLSDSNEADEDAPFEATTDPETVVVTVDGTRFERDWPGFEQPGLPCDDPNRAGIEVWIENGDDGSPAIRIEADCQHVTID